MQFLKIREAVRDQPFRPFVIHMADGRNFRVPGPEWLLAPPKDVRTIVLYTPEDDGHVMLDVASITSLTFDSAGLPKTG